MRIYRIFDCIIIFCYVFNFFIKLSEGDEKEIYTLYMNE